MKRPAAEDELSAHAAWRPDLLLLGVRLLALLEEARAVPRYAERLAVKTGGRVLLLATAEVDWVGAEGNYVRLHSGKKSYLLREAIGSMEARLDPRTFVRIHRSTIVRLDCVRELQPWSHGEYRVILYDGTQLTLSRSYRDRLQAALGNTL
ncbi:MAG TPA: LytTR family DNA-binding domain-containing protein [Pyrinomonadaceae bacterium]|nr:LytTR family DNA-binding domain-containing protein [Pyrinomonadaceae bacterium]